MKGIESTKQFFRGEDSKINGVYEQQQLSGSPYNTKNTNNDKILSPNSTSEKQGQVTNQTSRNLSVLNIKKSSARFLNPLNHFNSSGESGPLMGTKIPSTLIDKYPGTTKPENPLQMPPRGVREAKNQQLFDKYVNRQNRKISHDLSNQGGVNSANFNENGAASSGFALPSLGNPGVSNLQGILSNQKQGGGGLAAPAITNGRNMPGQQSKYSSRQNRKDPVRASLSDSDFDF